MKITDVSETKKSLFLVAITPKNQSVSYEFEQWVTTPSYEREVKEMILNHINSQESLVVKKINDGVDLVYKVTCQGKEMTDMFSIDKSEIASVDIRFVRDSEGRSKELHNFLDRCTKFNPEYQAMIERNRKKGIFEKFIGLFKKTA